MRFSGKGLIQLTGRANYRDMTRWLGWADCPDFEAHPDELAAPRWAALSACAFWASRDLNAMADAGDFEGITRKINGGLNGHADRVVRLQRARQALASQIDAGAPITPAPIPAQPPAPAAPPATQSSETSFGPRIPAGESGDAPENNMAPALIPLAIDAIGELVPSLIRTFGSGSQMAERNAKAAELAVAVAKKAAGAVNEQDLIEKLKTDPATQAAVKVAVTERLGDILDLMVRAAETDEKMRAGALDRNLQLAKATGGRWLYLLGGISILTVVFAFSVVWQVLFGDKAHLFSEGVKMLLIGQVVLATVALVFAFLFGTNLQNRISQARGEPQP